MNYSWEDFITSGNRPSPREKPSLCLLGKHALILFGGYYCSPNTESEFNYNDTYLLNLENLEWN